MEKVALEAGMFDIGVKREEEYEALLHAGLWGFKKAVGHRSSDEEIFVLSTPVPEGLDTTDYDTLKASLEEQGYKILPLLEWANQDA